MDSQIYWEADMEFTKEDKEVPENLSRLVIDYCDPLFISTRPLSQQKNIKKSNGTITYLKYKGQLWGITNSHVSECENSSKILALYGYGTPPIHLTEENFYGGFKSLQKNGDKSYPDIAIIKFCDKVKSTHFDSNFRKAIDLDRWEEPLENEIVTPVAFGFPTEHKTQNGLVTSSPLVLVTGRISSGWSQHHNSFSFHAQLNGDSDYYLSGISGGPIFHAENREDNPLIIGITYEGSPGSKENESTLFGMNNAVVSGYTLTPKIFEQWLSDAGFIDFK